MSFNFQTYKKVEPSIKTTSEELGVPQELTKELIEEPSRGASQPARSSRRAGRRATRGSSPPCPPKACTREG